MSDFQGVYIMSSSCFSQLTSYYLSRLNSNVNSSKKASQSPGLGSMSRFGATPVPYTDLTHYNTYTLDFLSKVWVLWGQRIFLTLRLCPCVGGPPSLMTCQEDSQDSVNCCSHGCDLLQQKDTKQNQQKEKAHGAMLRGNQVQMSTSPFPGKPHKTH